MNYQNDIKYAVVDLETTGFLPKRDEIIEICIITITNGEIQDIYETLIKPSKPVNLSLTKIHRIDNDMLSIAPEKEELIPIIKDKLLNTILVEHNRNNFDSSFLENFLSARPWITTLNTLSFAKQLYPNLKKYSLEFLCKYKTIPVYQDQQHTAKGDALSTAKLFISFQKELNK